MKRRLTTDWEESQAPNFMVAIKINNEEVLQKIAQLQAAVTDQQLYPCFWMNVNWVTTTTVFKEAMILPGNLHVPLYKMHLSGEPDLERTKEILTEVCTRMRDSLMGQQLDICFDGLEDFAGRVYMARIEPLTASYYQLRYLLRVLEKRFNEEFKSPVASLSSRPNLPIADITLSPLCRARRVPSFPAVMWQPFLQTGFGKQNVTELQLLEIDNGDPPSGNFVCHGIFPFS